MCRIHVVRAPVFKPDARPHTLPASYRAGFGIALSCWQRRELGEEIRPDALEERRVHTPDRRRSNRSS